MGRYVLALNPARRYTSTSSTSSTSSSTTTVTPGGGTTTTYPMGGPFPPGIIFQDSFDSQPDWSSPLSAIQFPYGSSMYANATKQPPVNWTEFRSGIPYVGQSFQRPVYRIRQTPHAHRGVGKCVEYNIEAEPYNDLTNSWSGGDISKWLGLDGYQELYVLYWIKYSREWKWQDSDQHTGAQQKLCRIMTYNRELSTHQTFLPAPTSNGGHAHNGDGSINLNYLDRQYPVWMVDYYCNPNYGGYAVFQQSFRVAPDYVYTPTGAYWVPNGQGLAKTTSDVQWPSDGDWHSYEFHVKMNSAYGADDGIAEFWLDDVLVFATYNVPWKGAYGPHPEIVTRPYGWNWVYMMDNAILQPYQYLGQHNMTIFIDDFVISTSRITKSYVIGS